MRTIIFVLFGVLAGAAQLTLAAKPTKAQSDELRELKTLLEKQRQYLNVLEKRIEQLSEQETKKKSVVTTPKTKPLQRQNAVGLMTLGVRDDDVGRGFQQRQQLGDPSLQT